MRTYFNGQEIIRIDWSKARDYKEGSKEYKEVERLIRESELTGNTLTPEQIYIKEQREIVRLQENETLQKNIIALESSNENPANLKNPYDRSHKHYGQWITAHENAKQIWGRKQNELYADGLRKKYSKQDALLNFIDSLERELPNLQTGEFLSIWNDKLKAFQKENNLSDLEMAIGLYFCNPMKKRNTNY